MGSVTIVCGAFLATLILITDATNETINQCILLPSRPGRCIHVLDGTKQNECSSKHGGFGYVPTSMADLAEIRKILYFRDVKGDKFITGLKYNGKNHSLYFERPANADNVWDLNHKGKENVKPQDINFDVEHGINQQPVVIEFTDNTIRTNTWRSAQELPLLCEASRHPDFPCPDGFQIFRPTNRCFKVHPEEVNPLKAEEECKKEHATTASVNSEIENDFIRKLIDEYDGSGAWLGMRFAWQTINEEYMSRGIKPPTGSSSPAVFIPFMQKYMYNLDGSPIGTYHNFDYDQPDFVVSNEFFIVQLRDKTWHDYPSGNRFMFVCSLLPDQTEPYKIPSAESVTDKKKTIE